MAKSVISAYRVLSFAAIAATSVLVACGPEDGELLESAAAGSSPIPAVTAPAPASPTPPVPSGLT